MLLWYQVWITAVLSIVLLNLWHNLSLLRKPAHTGPLPDPPPLVSVLIPARDEARNIGPCLRSVLAQDYPALQVLVLDDHSEDRTFEIASALAGADPRLGVLHGKPLPEGWHGKAYACHQLAQHASGEWLCFVDADTLHASGSITAVLRTALAEEADLITFLPHIVAGTFWEKVVLPLVNFAFLTFLPLGMVTTSKDPFMAAALGPFMFFRRSTYIRLGGHASVKDAIVEDVWLGRRVKQVGGRLLLMDGSDLLSVRFYQGLRETWCGLSKSAFAALDYALLPMLLAAVLNLAMYVGPACFLVRSAITGEATLALRWLPLLQMAMAWRMRLWLADRLHMDPLYALLHPLTMLLAAMIVLHSMWNSTLGPGVVWKGRSYQFGRTSRR